MKKIITLLGTITLLLVTTSAVYARPPHLNWGYRLNTGMCDQSGSPVINVVQEVINTVDSGEDGNNWAFDNLTRTILVWPQGNVIYGEYGEYCAIVRYDGIFDSQSGQQSPGVDVPGAVLDGDEDGTFQGGYRGKIFGALLPESTWITQGNLGTIDYQCNISGYCPGSVNWFYQYFTQNSSLDLDWWGWIYRAGDHGTWVNSSDGNYGDIY